MVVNSVFGQFGKAEIDLFASNLNTICTKYASYKPDPDAYQLYAFFLCWLDLNSYIVPPFNKIGRVLAKLAQVWAGSLGDSPFLSNIVMIPSICVVDEPGTTLLFMSAHNCSPSTPAPATRNKLTTSNLGSSQSSSNSFWALPNSMTVT